MLWVELDTKEWPAFVHYPLICLVVCICEQDQPVGGHSFRVDSKAVILSCDEAAFGGGVNARLIVSTVAIPTCQVR